MKEPLKRRMSAAERVALEAEARPIVSLYLERAARASHGRAPQSIMRLVNDVLQRGVVTRPSTTGGLRLSPEHQWLLAVEWIWQAIERELGPAARHVLILRLSR